MPHVFAEYINYFEKVKTRKFSSVLDNLTHFNFRFCFSSTTCSVDELDVIDEDDSEVASLSNSIQTNTNSRASSSVSSRNGSSPAPLKRRRRTKDDDSGPDIILETLMNRMEAADSKDHVHDFLFGYASTLREFPPVLLAKTKRKIANIISDAEIEHLESKQRENVPDPHDAVVSSPTYRYDEYDVEYIDEEVDLTNS